MAGFFQQLRLLLWKNALSVIRQPGWSLALLIWPLVIFIILAVTRSQFPPVIKDSCYVAPRNLPSAGFFPFLQTLMCNTDSSCSNKSYLSDRSSRSYSLPRSRRPRRDLHTPDTESSSPLLEGLPHLAHLQKGGLVHAILKRDTSNQSGILDLWDTMLNSSADISTNMTATFLNVLNSTVLADQNTLKAILDSVGTLKNSFCSFYMSGLNLSNTDHLSSAVVRLCSSNDTVVEVSLATLNEFLAQSVLQNPVSVIQSIEMAVMALGQMQTDTPLWDFLLGLPNLFQNSSDQGNIMSVTNSLLELKRALTSIQSSFPLANGSVDALNPAIDEGVLVLQYLQTWQGRGATIAFTDVLGQYNQSLLSPEISQQIQNLHIPLDKVTVLFNSEAFYNFVCPTPVDVIFCNKLTTDILYGWINQEKVALQVLVAWSQSSASADLSFFKDTLSSFLNPNGIFRSKRNQRSAADPAGSLPEQLVLNIGDAVVNMLKGLPLWENIRLFLMEVHSTMRIANEAMNTQIRYMETVLPGALDFQQNFQSVMLNQDVADAWVRNIMDSTVQTVANVMTGHMDCRHLAAPWTWMSKNISITPELWAELLCPGNGSGLEEMFSSISLPLIEQVNLFNSVVKGDYIYDPSPAAFLDEGYILYSTYQKYTSSLQMYAGALQQQNFTNWIPQNMPVDWSAIIMTRGLEKLKDVGSLLQQSGLWSSMEPYFNMAYWIMTFQPNITGPPNCTFSSGETVCQTGFTWDEFIPVLGSLLGEVNSNPDALLRPIQGAQALLQSIYKDTYMNLLKQFLSSSGTPLADVSSQNLLLHLAALVDNNIQLLSNITSIDQFSSSVLLDMLNAILQGIGLGQSDVLWSGATQSTDLNTVVMDIIQLLSPNSIQTLNNQGQFALLDALIGVLGQFLPHEQQNQLEGLLNHTHALIADLLTCSATGQDCLGEVEKALNMLSLFAELNAVGTDINVTLTYIQGNMTLSVTNHLLNLILPWNISGSHASTTDIVNRVLQLLEQMSSSHIINVVSLNQALQALNLTISDLELFTNLPEVSDLQRVLSNLMNTINISQCLNNTSSGGSPGSSEAQCSMMLVEGAIGFLQFVPGFETTVKIMSASLPVIYEQVMSLWKVNSTQPVNPLGETKDILDIILQNIRQNLQNLNLDNGTLTQLNSDLSVLEGLLNVAINERYPYQTINSTLMSQPLYAQKVYDQIAQWYLEKLETAINETTFRSLLQPFIRLMEMEIQASAAQANLSVLVSNQIPDLMSHAQLPLDEANVNTIFSAVKTLLEAQLQLIKMNLEIQQVFFDSMGLPMNSSLPANIEADVMNYLNSVQNWTLDFASVLQWSNSSFDITALVMNLEHLVQDIIPSISIEDQAFLGMIEQASQSLDHLIQLGITDGGVQSENFTEALMDSIKMLLASAFNTTIPLSESAVENITSAIHTSLQLLLNSNLSYAQSQEFLVQAAYSIKDFISVLNPQYNEALTPVFNTVLAYISSVSKPAGTDWWTENIIFMIETLQMSLPPNSTAASYITVVQDIINFMLNSNQGNTSLWAGLQQLNSSSLDELGKQLSIVLESLQPFLTDQQGIDWTVQSVQALTESLPILVQVLSGGTDQITFSRLESLVTVLLSSLMDTPVWNSLPSALDMVRNILVSMVQSIQVQTNIIHHLSEVLPNVFHVDSANVSLFISALPQALQSTLEATMQAGVSRQVLNCTEVQLIWDQVSEAAGLNISVFTEWCHVDLFQLVGDYQNLTYPPGAQNSTGPDPQWLNTMAAEIVGSLEAFYSSSLNESLAMQHLAHALMQWASSLNLSLSETESLANWTGLFFPLQEQQRLFQIALEILERESPLDTLTWKPYITAVQKTIEYVLRNSYFTQSPSTEIVIQAVEVILTAMNFSSDHINSILNSVILSSSGGGLSPDVLIKELIKKVVDMQLLGYMPILYDQLNNILSFVDSSHIFEKAMELYNWYSTTQDTGVDLVMQILSKLYEMVNSVLPAASQLTNPLPYFSDTVFQLASNVFYLLRQISQTSNLFAPIDNYFSPIQMQLSQGKTLMELVAQSKISRMNVSNANKEPVDDFLDLFGVDYQTLAQALSVPLTSEELLETVHGVFANPDLAILLKGVTGASSQDQTIDKALDVLSYLTLPSSGQNFVEMFTQISNEGWSLNSLEKIGQLANSVGRIIDMSLVLSQESPVSIAQRVEQMAEQLSSAASYIAAQQSNGTGLELLKAVDTILLQNLQEMTKNNNSMVAFIIQSIFSYITAPGTGTDLVSYVQAVNQTAQLFVSLFPTPEAQVYFHVSTQMLKGFAMLASNPRDANNMLLGVYEIANALNNTLTFSNMATLPNGKPVQEVMYPFILSNALATQILLNLSVSNYTFSSALERGMILTKLYDTMVSNLPVEAQVYLHPLKSALFYALSNVTSTTQIQFSFFEISQQVTMSLLASLNVTEDPLSNGMTSGSLAQVLFTVSSEVTRVLYESQTPDHQSSMQLLNVLSSLDKVIVSLSSVLPGENQHYLNISLSFMESVAFAMNLNSSTEDITSGMDMFSSSILHLLGAVPNINQDISGDILASLVDTLKMLLSAVSPGQDPLAESSATTQQVLLAVQNLLSLSSNSSELDLARMILKIAEMNASPLLMTNNTNWADNLPLVLTNIADSLPDNLQLGPLNKAIIRSLANESQENLNQLLQAVSTVSELLYTDWMSEKFTAVLNQLQTQVCNLEKMDSIQQLSQALSLGPGLLCHVVVPTIQTLNVVSNNLVNQSSGVYQQLFQSFVGDPYSYDMTVDWNAVLMKVTGFNISSFGNIQINMTSQSVVKVSDLLKNRTLFVSDVLKYISIDPVMLNTLLEATLPNSNLQILSWLANLRNCPGQSSMNMDPTEHQIFMALCSLPPQEMYRLAVLMAQHIDMENAVYKMVLSSEIQGTVGVLMQILKFFTDIMSKLAPALDRLQEYLVNFGNLNLMANSEFRTLVRGKRSVISSRATFVTISRAMCKNGMLSLFGISKLPNLAEADPSFKDPQRVDELMTKFKIPRDATPFCTNFYLDMVSTTGGAVAWAFLKPMLLGQVLYYPETPLTREIIQKSNATLQQFGDLRVYAEEWLHSSSYLTQSAQILNKTLPMIQNSLKNPFVQNFIKKQTDIDVEQMQQTLQQFSNMTEMLQKNQLILQQISTLSNLMMNLSDCVNFNRYHGYNSSEELDKQAEKLAHNRELYASVIFNLPSSSSSSSSSSGLPPKVDYKIRMHIDNSMRTDRSRNPFWVKASYISPLKTQRYIRGFAYLQEGIERAIIAMQSGKEVKEPAVQVQAFPYPCFYKDEYLNSISFAFPLVLMIAWVLFIANFVKKLVHERELRLHEYMKMMGVNPISHFFAWFIESAVFVLITVIILTIILKGGGVLPKSDGFILFLYLCDYGLSILAISFLVSSFFDKTNIAGLSGSLIYVISFFPFIVVMSMEETMSFFAKSVMSLFSPTCFSYASQYISRYEKQEEGIQWSNMYISPVAGDTSSFGWLCWLLVIDSLIYFLLGAYIRMVFPGKYGIAAPWYFPVLPSFWSDMFGCCSRAPRKVGRGLLFSNMVQDTQRSSKDKGKDVGDFHTQGDEEFTGLPVGVSLQGLTKTYGSRKAIENLNLSFYEGHVTSLLGHNGAGKTTTMSLLTGLFSPSSGSIEVYGKDMQAFMDDVRQELGVCMQYDVHFDHLTAKEHLMLYGQIKAPHWTKQELEQQVRKILKETGMYAHRHKRVGTLSGGMKRKLSISIAFIGGSRLVVLDEPTTGVDPCSRRSIWEIILQHKQERTIILSTHHLDEAEVLSDRIAFLERGGLKCCGSPYYLKDKLAQGYNLTLTKKVQPPESEEKFDSEEVKAFILSHMPEARQKEGEVGDVVYCLPAYSSQNAPAYRSLLTSLDKNLDSLQLGCYGISDTTLEEVFLQLTRDDLEPVKDRPSTVSETVQDTAASRESLQDDLNSSMYLGERASLTGNSTVSGLALTAQQVMAMLVKRFHHTRRDWKGLISQVLLPVLFVIAAMGLGSIKSDLQTFPEMEISPALYDTGKAYAFFSNQNPNSTYLVDTMMSYPGIDHYCMSNPNTEVCRARGTAASDGWTSGGNGSSWSGSCKCGGFLQTCQKPVSDPPHKTNPSTQIVYNLTGIDIENYLLVTANDFVRDRYGGWSFGNALPTDLQMDIMEVPKNRTLTKVWYNPEGHHTLPAYLNSLNNFILRSNIPADQRQKYAISLSSHPYPGQVEDEDAMVRGLVNVLVALCVLTGYSIMTASFVIYEVQEHHSGSKMLQHISGISEPFYWTINFIYDMALYMIPVILSVIMIAAFQLTAFTGHQNLEAVTLLLVLFGFASFPWMYLISTMFKDAEMAFISYVCINLFISVNTIISTAIIYFLGQLHPNDENVQVVYRIMSYVFLIFPQFSFGNGLMELARVDMQVQILSVFGVDAYKNPFSMDVLGWMFLSLFLHGFVFFTVRLLLNKWLLRKVRRLFCRRKSVPQTGNCNEDKDVLAERQRVDSGAASSDLLQVSQLTKVYQHLSRKVKAVKDLSFGIPAGECFGLLGVNGAGKTTTFKMLTGDISPTNGSAQVRDWDGRLVDMIDCRTEGINIGYCPQVDALDDLLTGEEHLYFYARIRGIAKREIHTVVNYLLKKLELDYHRQIISDRYSCGTRRKLSTALALIGKPQILLLDEPSSGMDPRSKRHLWKIISEEVMGKCAVVLTSHSMEECEALCSRLAIMVQGQFRCLGSLQHIKNRFGSGFTVKMYLTTASSDVDAITRFMEQHFPSTYLKDHHSAMVEYHVPLAPGGVADIFDQLEPNKAALQIKHFSVSQTTLDEVFINFAMGKAGTESEEVNEASDADSLETFSAVDS
ncbi:glucosylceramide transporter ABCA12 [Astyanax mexicanus]|uniref:glucosylceramide transporter ABCA12 n=1 Tax=Astyanax mexicanus TaxID=7994 RepID=UPI0020CB576E|nr:glucosylceramide transporter ABCA12 [Astyanax mexicanus]